MLTATARAAAGRGLGFDAAAVVSREFRCISRGSRCGFARIPASRGLFRPVLGGPFRLPTATARAVGRGLAAVVSREFRCISMLWFRANSGLSWPLQASSGGHLGCCGFERIPLHFDAPAVVCANFGLSWPLQASSGGGT